MTSVFTQHEFGVLVESLLKSHPGGLTTDAIVAAVGQLEGMRIDGTLVEMTLARRLDISWNGEALLFRDPKQEVST